MTKYWGLSLKKIPTKSENRPKSTWKRCQIVLIMSIYILSYSYYFFRFIFMFTLRMWTNISIIMWKTENKKYLPWKNWFIKSRMTHFQKQKIVFVCLSVYVSPTCHDVGCSALVNSLPSLSYRLLSSSAPSISYTYMSVSEISTLKDRCAQTDILGPCNLETLSVNLFLPDRFCPLSCQSSESLLEKNTLACWPIILSVGNLWNT